jgi:AcrR family transcriptional regulator
MEDRNAARARPSKGDERRQRVLQAALAAITERGIPDTRMADIAARAGMSPGHVLYYFRSKAHILTEVLRWNEDRFHEQLQSKLGKTTTAREAAPAHRRRVDTGRPGRSSLVAVARGMGDVAS